MSYALTRWLAVSQDRRGGGNYAPGAVAWSQRIGGDINLLTERTANSEALLAKAITEAIKEALIDHDLVGRPKILFIVPHTMERYLNELLPRWREAGAWTRPDGKIWHEFDSAWALIYGELLKARDEDDLEELARLLAAARSAAKRVA